MLYRPKNGQIKDGCMIYKDGFFYLFSMYRKHPSAPYKNIWLATSRDGVHFCDYGCVVEDFPSPIWAMKVYRVDHLFYMNSGSFSEAGHQTVLKFWRSEDLFHWEYLQELDVLAPNEEEKGARLDCMNVLCHNGRYHGFATGQYGYLTSEDGAHWSPHKAPISYAPFPEYNPALGGFEIADCVKVNGAFYLLCGGFGHLGVNGYGVYVYRSERPEGPYTPSFPYYRLNGTSGRWVNMWARCLSFNNETLIHHYMYNGYTYEMGEVYFPPIKRLVSDEFGLRLGWWEGNDALLGEPYATCESLSAECERTDVFETDRSTCKLSEERISLPEEGAVIDLTLTLSLNSFTRYSAGGIYLGEDERSGLGISFDTYGSCELLWICEENILKVEDRIGFGSASLYALESGKPYSVRILTRKGMLEIYVNGIFLQTFNTAHTKGTLSRPLLSLHALALRASSRISKIQIRRMEELS